MVAASFIVLLNIIFVSCNVVDHRMEPELRMSDNLKGPGKPLYLTSYIENGDLEKARQLSSVKPFVENIVSYSGYLTVDKESNSNIFFWYFQSETDHKNTPTVVWLQGGPGSSMYSGVFYENGPYMISRNKIFKRKYTWSKISNLIYFDSPVGTGYSFTEKESAYATDQTKVGKDLYEALLQIYKLFPHMQENNLFITGESYAGKYVPALGRTIHIRNQKKPQIVLNLKGMMIGNGLSDPEHMLKYGDYLYQLGLIDENAKNEFHNFEIKVVTLIKHKKWEEASRLMMQIVGDENSLFSNYTGLKSYFNYVSPNSKDDEHKRFITGNYFRHHTHVGNRTLNDGQKVFKYLYNDISKSVIDWVVDLLKYYRILYYNGQLDVVCAYPLTENVLKNMKWPLSHEYKKANRHIFKVNGDVAGYYKTVGNLTEALIRNAGHMVPANQPVSSFHMFHDFLHNKFTVDENS